MSRKKSIKIINKKNCILIYIIEKFQQYCIITRRIGQFKTRISIKRMVLHRIDNILIIYPRSKTTLVQFGLHDTFEVPDIEIPTVIYKDNTNNKYYPRGGENRVEIRPIEKGNIINLEAFLNFLRLIYASCLENRKSENPSGFEYSVNNIPLLLISNYKWSQDVMESINHFVFEHLKMNGLMIIPSALCACYSMVSLQNCCIIDIGYEHTDIIPIVDYSVIQHLSSSINYGGNYINKILSKKLPQLNELQIEDLKKSKIFEVLSDADKSTSAFDFSASGNGDEDNNDNFDIATIINSNKDTREFLSENEKKKKQGEKILPNSQLEYNTFIDSNQDEIKIGKQRFQGCDELINKISNRLGHVLRQIEDINKTNSVWENIIVIGNTSMINGFKEALINKLIEDHLIVEPVMEKSAREQANYEANVSNNNDNQSNNNSIGNNKKRNKFFGAPFLPGLEYLQGCNNIKLSKYPEYFPEWKKQGYGDISFLGGQIVSKQIFTHSKDTFYITRAKYENLGPGSVWSVEF